MNVLGDTPQQPLTLTCRRRRFAPPSMSLASTSTSSTVMGCDIDLNCLLTASKNLALYGVDRERVLLVWCDSVKLLRKLKDVEGGTLKVCRGEAIRTEEGYCIFRFGEFGNVLGDLVKEGGGEGGGRGGGVIWNALTGELVRFKYSGIQRTLSSIEGIQTFRHSDILTPRIAADARAEIGVDIVIDSDENSVDMHVEYFNTAAGGLFLSPPWNNTGYYDNEIWKTREFSLQTDVSVAGMDGFELVELGLNVAKLAVVFLPANVFVGELKREWNGYNCEHYTHNLNRKNKTGATYLRG